MNSSRLSTSGTVWQMDTDRIAMLAKYDSAMSTLRSTWNQSQPARHACQEPIRAIGLIIVIIFAFYPSILALYGVSVGVGVLVLAAAIKPTKASWLLVILMAAIGYWYLWLALFD